MCYLRIRMYPDGISWGCIQTVRAKSSANLPTAYGWPCRVLQGPMCDCAAACWPLRAWIPPGFLTREWVWFVVFRKDAIATDV